MRGVRLRLEEFRQVASTSECEIIDFVLEHPRKAAGASLKELANESGTSPSTVQRLCRKLGCSGYREFQEALVYEVALSGRSKDVALGGVLSGDSTQTVIDKVTSRNISSLELTSQLLDDATVDEAVALMMCSDRICLFGVGASLLVAHDLELKLLRLDVPCLLCDDLHSQLLYAKNTHAGDLAIAVSYSGLTTEVLNCVRTARTNGAKVVSITRGSFDSPLASLSDCVLGVAATELLVRSGAMSSRIAQLNVVDVLFAAYVNKNYQKSIRRISTNFISKERP